MADAGVVVGAASDGAGGGSRTIGVRAGMTWATGSAAFAAGGGAAEVGGAGLVGKPFCQVCARTPDEGRWS